MMFLEIYSKKIFFVLVPLRANNSVDIKINEKGKINKG